MLLETCLNINRTIRQGTCKFKENHNFLGLKYFIVVIAAIIQSLSEAPFWCYKSISGPKFMRKTHTNETQNFKFFTILEHFEVKND